MESPLRPPKPKDTAREDTNNPKLRECTFQHPKPTTSHPLSFTRVSAHLCTSTRPQSLNMLQHQAMDLPLHLTMLVTLHKSQLTTVEPDTLLKRQLMIPDTHHRHHLMTLELTLLKSNLTLLKNNLTLLKNNLTLLKNNLTPHNSRLTTLDPVTLLKSSPMTLERVTALRHRPILKLDPSQTTPNSSHRLTIPVPAIQLLQLSHNKKQLQFMMPEQHHHQLVVTQSRATSGRQ